MRSFDWRIILGSYFFTDWMLKRLVQIFISLSFYCWKFGLVIDDVMTFQFNVWIGLEVAMFTRNLTKMICFFVIWRFRTVPVLAVTMSTLKRNIPYISFIFLSFHIFYLCSSSIVAFKNSNKPPSKTSLTSNCEISLLLLAAKWHVYKSSPLQACRFGGRRSTSTIYGVFLCTIEDISYPPLSLSKTTFVKILVSSIHCAGRWDFQAKSAVEWDVP